MFFLQNWFTEKNYALPFSKLKLNESIYEEEVTKKIDLHKGIFIDIFPYDEVSKNKFKFKFQKYSSEILQRIIIFKSDYNLSRNKMSKNIIRIIVNKLFWIIKKKSLIKVYEQVAISSKNNSDYYVCTGGSYGFQKEIVEKNWFEKSTLVNFEGLKVAAPLKYKEYLENLYGDYLKLPPEEERISRHKIEKKEITLRMLELID